jgi:large subunit ribosomal protein L18
MKFSKRVLLKLKNKNKKLKPDKYKKLKRASVRGLIKGTSTTLVSCSTLDRDIKLNTQNGRTCDASRLMGQKLAELSHKKNIKRIVFDRGPYLYHGRVKALADGARAGGLQF